MRIDRGTSAPGASLDTKDLQVLLPHVVLAASGAGDRLYTLFSRQSRVWDRDSLVQAAHRNEDASAPGLRNALGALRPSARWLDDDLGTSPLPLGEWWVVDTVEGNVNHIHGLDDWCVSITLIRDEAPVLAVVRQPVADRTYTAVRGAGAHLDGARLGASRKQGLDVAIVETGQAEAGQATTYPRIGASITAMLHSAMLVRASVPSTFPLLRVATGQDDAFWQYEPNLTGIAAGVLLVIEAGGVISRTDGSPWTPGSPDILAAAPGVHPAAVEVLHAL